MAIRERTWDTGVRTIANAVRTSVRTLRTEVRDLPKNPGELRTEAVCDGAGRPFVYTEVASSGLRLGEVRAH